MFVTCVAVAITRREATATSGMTGGEAIVVIKMGLVPQVLSAILLRLRRITTSISSMAKAVMFPALFRTSPRPLQASAPT